MAAKNSIIKKPEYTHHRVAAGAPVAADPTDFSTIPISGAVNCEGWEILEGFVLLTGGAVPTVTLQPIERVKYTADDGSEKDEFIVGGANIGALSSGDQFSFTANNGMYMFRIDAVTGAPTKVEILLAGGKRL